jgi:signal transduction histidine kinase
METPVLGSLPPDGLESKLTCVALTLSHVTHMVRGRLQSMRNWLYVINRKPADGPALAARVDAEIVELEARLEALMSLPMALRPPRLESVELDVLAAAVVGTLGDAGRRVEWSAPRGIGRVNADPAQLQLAVRSLLTHALSTGSAQERVLMSVARNSSGISLVVEGPGPGRPLPSPEEALDPFDGLGGPGLGLDLGTAFTVARSHGGTLELEAMPGRGTRLTFGPLAADAV